MQQIAVGPKSLAIVNFVQDGIQVGSHKGHFFKNICLNLNATAIIFVGQDTIYGAEVYSFTLE